MYKIENIFYFMYYFIYIWIFFNFTNILSTKSNVGNKPTIDFVLCNFFLLLFKNK